MKKLKKEDIELLEMTKIFAESHDLYFDEFTEDMLKNALIEKNNVEFKKRISSNIMFFCLGVLISFLILTII